MIRSDTSCDSMSILHHIFCKTTKNTTDLSICRHNEYVIIGIAL